VIKKKKPYQIVIEIILNVYKTYFLLCVFLSIDFYLENEIKKATSMLYTFKNTLGMMMIIIMMIVMMTMIKMLIEMMMIMLI
jgi:hypothetical protein